ncbi:Hypothetical predicted protein [Lecanosticta acicola]|uniref:Secreted protein n=1 Tax=Lecanosticta acicola TaxID=111012 RepID=A0AAI8YUN0_9PEZI|nr:Hypothetical predicted protein [Lecanosticta acicola]
MRPSILLAHAYLLIVPLTPPTKAWAVGFYGGQNCYNDADLSDILYQGSGKKGHTQCLYYAHNGGAEQLSCISYWVAINHRKLADRALTLLL